MCVDTVLWQFEFDQVEAAVVHNAQALPEENNFGGLFVLCNIAPHKPHRSALSVGGYTPPSTDTRFISPYLTGRGRS